MAYSHNWWSNPPETMELIRAPRYNPFSATRNMVFIQPELTSPSKILDIKIPADFSEKMKALAKGYKIMAQKLHSNEHRPCTTREDLEAVERAINDKKEMAAVAEKKYASDLEVLEKRAEELKARIKDEDRLKEMECTVSMLPVCSCGHVFKDLEIALPKTTRLYGDSDHEIPDVGAPRFSQIFCPSCNKKLSAYVNRMSFDRCDGIISVRPE